MQNKFKSTDKYNDIINLPHYKSKKRNQMSMMARAAQFAPFSALTGLSDEIKETARLTFGQVNFTEEIKEEINYKLQYIKDNISQTPYVTVSYFVKDLKKSGGQYVAIKDKVKKVDEDKKVVVFCNGEVVNIESIGGIIIED